MSSPVMLGGSELVLVARIPKGGGRWKQAHFNRKLATEFFHVVPGSGRTVRLERVNRSGRLEPPVTRPLVYSEASNKNCKIELDFDAPRYPGNGPPIVAIVDLGVRSFRYRSVLPGYAGYQELWDLTEEKPSVGRGFRRILISLDELELRWPSSGLRAPLS